MLDRHRDIESDRHLEQHDSADNKPILEPQLNVGGHGATQRRLKDYHVTMIGLCSGIGTGLFIGTGAAYANAGPAGLLLAYLVVGSVLWCVMQSIAELATVVGTSWPSPPSPAHHHLDPHCWVVSAFCEPLHRPCGWVLPGHQLWILLHHLHRRGMLRVCDSRRVLD
jgi:amino acid transporter